MRQGGGYGVAPARSRNEAGSDFPGHFWLYGAEVRPDWQISGYDRDLLVMSQGHAGLDGNGGFDDEESAVEPRGEGLLALGELGGGVEAGEERVDGSSGEADDFTDVGEGSVILWCY